MNVKQINIKHPILGDIAIYSTIPDNIQQKIGDVVLDYSKTPLLYHSKIVPNDDNTFSIIDLMVIKPEAINIGHMNNSKGIKNFITVITNKIVCDDVCIYPSAIMSVI